MNREPQLAHQDWETIVFHRKKTKTKTKTKTQATNINQPVTRYHAGSNQQRPNVRATQIEQKAEEVDHQLPKVTHSLQFHLQRARTDKGWTQKQLAQACNLPIVVVREYENGTAIPKSHDLQKMSQALGVTLRNK